MPELATNPVEKCTPEDFHSTQRYISHVNCMHALRSTEKSFIPKEKTVCVPTESVGSLAASKYVNCPLDSDKTLESPRTNITLLYERMHGQRIPRDAWLAAGTIESQSEVSISSATFAI